MGAAQTLVPAGWYWMIGEREGRAPWPHATLSRWETGRQLPGPGTRAAIAAIGGIGLDELKDSVQPPPLRHAAAVQQPMQGAVSALTSQPPQSFTGSMLRWLYGFLHELADAGASRRDIQVAEFWLARAAHLWRAAGAEPGDATALEMWEEMANGVRCVLSRRGLTFSAPVQPPLVKRGASLQQGAGEQLMAALSDPQEFEEMMRMLSGESIH